MQFCSMQGRGTTGAKLVIRKFQKKELRKEQNVVPGDH